MRRIRSCTSPGDERPVGLPHAHRRDRGGDRVAGGASCRIVGVHLTTRPLSRPRDAASIRLSSVPSASRCVRIDPIRVIARVERAISGIAVQRAARPRASAARGRRARGAAARRAGTRDSRREGDQSLARAPWSGLAGSLPRSGARDAAGGSSRARVRVAELPQARARSARIRPVLVRPVVLGLARADRSAVRTAADRRRADVARMRRLATARTPRCQ
jgi:hypothetical protein